MSAHETNANVLVVIPRDAIDAFGRCDQRPAHRSDDVGPILLRMAERSIRDWNRVSAHVFDFCHEAFVFGCKK